jgi:four-jointed box protein 1
MNNLPQSFTQLDQISDGIFWTPQLEHLTPNGFSDSQVSKWRQHASNIEVSEIREGCGRMQNRLVVFNDGVKMCARYRINNDQIQGEVFSYYLAKALGVDKVLPPILAKADPSTRQWRSVSSAIDTAQWDAQKLFVLTPWLGPLEPAYIPEEFHSNKNNILSPNSQSLVNKTLDQLKELVQWSDLIILDYLTGNVDRVVNNMFNLQWNSGMMHAPTHNLEKLGPNGPLIFLDNESGLLHSYRLLDKYQHYHERLLKSLCIFKKSTVSKIRQFIQYGDIAQTIRTHFRSEEPLAEQLAFLPNQNLGVLSQRLVHIIKHVDSCQSNYANVP